MKIKIIIFQMLFIFAIIFCIVAVNVSTSVVTIDSGGANTGYNTQRKMAYDSNGNLYCVYYILGSDYDIKFANSSDNGTTWTTTELIGDAGIVEVTTHKQQRPSLAIDSNDTIHIVWRGNHSGSDDYQIRYINSTDNGASWSSSINITNNAYDHDSPSLAIDSLDNLYVVWDSCHAGSPGYYDIRFSKSADNGASWSASATISLGTNGDDYDASIAIDRNDTIHVVWDAYIDDGADEDICYSNSTDDGASWDTYTKISPYTDNSVPCVIVDNNDNIHVVWQGSWTGLGAYNIIYRKSTDGGISWLTAEHLTNEDSEAQSEPTITLDRDINLHVIWSGKIGGVYNIRCINYTGSWGTIWNTGISSTSYPVSLWSNYPINQNIPFSGFCFIYTNSTYVSFFKTDDFSMSHPPNTVYVDDDAPGGWYNGSQVATIQEGIDNVSSGGTIYVWDGTYNENININKALTIIGNSTETTIIKDNGADTITISTSNGVILSNLQINSSVSDGIYASGYSNMVITNCFFNDTLENGIIMLDAVNITIEDSIFTSCGSGGSYGGIWFENPGSDIDIFNCTFIDNNDKGIYMTDICYANISNNTLNDSIVISPSGSQMTNLNIYNNTFQGTPSLGYLYLTGSSVPNSIQNSAVYNNSFDNGTIGIYGYYLISSSIYNNTITNCDQDGVYIISSNDITLQNLTISYCSLSSGYSGIYCEDVDDILIDNCNISHIYRSPFGAVGSTAFGISLDGCSNILVNNSNFSNIKSHNSYSYGLRAYGSTSNITIRNCNFTEGQIGVYIGYSDNITIEDSDFINHIRGTGLGEPFIKLIECLDILIDNNTCSNNDYYTGFIFTDIAEFTISDNTVENTLDDSIGMLINAVSWDWSTSAYNKNGLIFNNSIANSTDIGLSLGDYNNVTAYNNTILDCGNDAGEYGVYLSGDGVITFYNNYIDNDANIYSSASNAIYNITKTLGTNIINGSYLGGNYWSDYNGVDINGDGLGDTLLPYEVSSGDYLPLAYGLDADFIYSPNNPSVNEQISFKDKSTGTITSYKWTFDDGSTSIDKNPTHSYKEYGEYDVKLTISDNYNTDSETKTIRISLEKEFSIIYPEPSIRDPYTIPEMYQLLNVDNIPYSDAEITIVFIDTGYTPRTYEGIDLSFIKGLKHPIYNSVYDEQGHGTWISYALGYIVHEKMPNAKLISYRLFDDSGQCTNQQVLDVFDAVLKLKPDVVSFSGGTIGSPDDMFSKKVDELRGSGITVVVAAGNSGPTPSTILSPAVSNSALAVGAVDPMRTILNLGDDKVCIWSSRGPVLDIVPKPDYTGPGESIVGPWLAGDRVVSGTSMATPLIAGGSAVIVASNHGILCFADMLYFWDGGFKPSMVEDSIARSCFDKGDENSYGYGIPDFEDANGILFWSCVLMIILWFLVLAIIIIVIYYWFFYRKRDEQKEKKKVKFGF